MKKKILACICFLAGYFLAAEIKVETLLCFDDSSPIRLNTGFDSPEGEDVICRMEILDDDKLMFITNMSTFYVFDLNDNYKMLRDSYENFPGRHFLSYSYQTEFIDNDIYLMKEDNSLGIFIFRDHKYEGLEEYFFEIDSNKIRIEDFMVHDNKVFMTAYGDGEKIYVADLNVNKDKDKKLKQPKLRRKPEEKENKVKLRQLKTIPVGCKLYDELEKKYYLSFSDNFWFCVKMMEIIEDPLQQKLKIENEDPPKWTFLNRDVVNENFIKQMSYLGSRNGFAYYYYAVESYSNFEDVYERRLVPYGWDVRFAVLNKSTNEVYAERLNPEDFHIPSKEYTRDCFTHIFSALDPVFFSLDKNGNIYFMDCDEEKEHCRLKRIKNDWLKEVFPKIDANVNDASVKLQ
ncbi:MAG: hypothetical protein MR449_06315 [Spirochaetia bacterium]|nr:hypothetical protein [Spirochaetia bacterium]